MRNKTIRGAHALAALCGAAVLMVMAPRLAGVGMFVDGITYATLARNLAEASPWQWWQLHYTDTLHSAFFEHPPLAMWLLAGTFRLVGDVPWAETLHCGLMTAAFFATVAALWRAARPPQPQETLGAWWLMGLTLAFPLTSWVLANNMLEGPMTVACLLCTTAMLRGWRSNRWQGRVLWGAAAGVALLAALLCKGPQALFLLAIPAAAPWLVPGVEHRASETTAAATTGVVLGGAACLFVAPSAHAYLAQYLHQQVFNSLMGQREIAASRLTALTRLVSELAVPAAVAAAAYVAMRRRAPKAHAISEARRPIIGWATLGLCASLPVLFSPKQSGWYIYQSLPFFAVAMAYATLPAALAVQAWAAKRVGGLQTCAGLLGAVALAVAVGRWGHIDRHHAFHHDFTAQAMPPLSAPAAVQVCPVTLLTDWGLNANMARSLRASLTAQPAPWLLVDTQTACTIPTGCSVVHPPQAQRYQLYRCSTEANSDAAAATPRKHS